MKKIITKSMLTIALLSTSVMAQTGKSIWTDWYPVGEVYTNSSGAVFIQLSPTSAHPNPAGCRTSGWLAVVDEQKNKDEIYQMALTAQAAGLKVNAYVYGTICLSRFVS